MDPFNQFSNNTMNGLVITVVGLLGILLWVSWRKPILAKLGVRNIPRRPTQSVLIVLGLTLSTIIIVSALSTGDTLKYSVRRQAIDAYGEIDEIIAPPLLSLLTSMDGSPSSQGSNSGDQAATAQTSEAEKQFNQLMAGGFSSVLAVLEGGLPGISTARYQQLKAEAAQEPQIDAIASSIIFPTIIRDDSTGQGEPLGFVFAVDSDYDQKFGLVTVDGEVVKMDDLRPGVGNIFVQANKLFALAQNAVKGTGAQLGLDLNISQVAMATAAIGAALTAGSDKGVDLANVSVDVKTLKGLGIDTKLLEDRGITSVSLASLGLDAATLGALGVTTTTVKLDALAQGVGINSAGLPSADTLLKAINLNTLSAEIDRTLAQYGLQLRQGDVYLNRLGAEKLNARVGDVLELYVGPIPIPFRVKAIVEQAGPIGTFVPVAMMHLDEAQKLFFMNGKVNSILVSNQGDAMHGIAHTDAVSKRLRALALDPEALDQVVAILRRPAVAAVIITEAGRVKESMQADIEAPPVIAAFVQNLGGVHAYQQQIQSLPQELARPGISDELRSLLADNSVRSWLTEQNLPSADRAELRHALGALNQFDVIDPLNKSTIVTVAAAGGAVFTSIFTIFGIFSILAGVMLVFLIFVMMAAERRSEMGMARAIGVQRSDLVQMFVTEGVLYDLVAACFGVILGLGISYLMIGYLGGIFNDVSAQFGGGATIFRLHFQVAPTSVIIAYCLGVLLTFVVVTLAAWRVTRLNIVAAIRDLPEEDNAGMRTFGNRIGRWLVGPLLMLAGSYLLFGVTAWGLTGLLLAATLILTGLILLIGQYLDERTALRSEPVQRFVYTIIGLGLLVIWAIPWNVLLGQPVKVTDQTNGYFLIGFVLQAPLIILGAIMIVMFNADAITWGVTLLLGGIGRLTPVLKTAIAYPLSSRFRTAMAMVMFAMIICTVVIMAVVIQATQAIIVLNDQQSAGFEISTSFGLLSFFDPIHDLAAEIAQQTQFPKEDIAVVGGVSRQTIDLRQVAPPDQTVTGAEQSWRQADVSGVDAGYLQQAEKAYRFQARAAGYADDAAVWEALRTAR